VAGPGGGLGTRRPEEIRRLRGSNPRPSALEVGAGEGENAARSVAARGPESAFSRLLPEGGSSNI
jgi:hypothetical protein